MYTNKVNLSNFFFHFYVSTTDEILPETELKLRLINFKVAPKDSLLTLKKISLLL